MAKRYIETTIVLDDATPSILEVSSREKEDDGEWSAPVANEDFTPTIILNFPWLHLEITRV